MQMKGPFRLARGILLHLCDNSLPALLSATKLFYGFLSSQDAQIAHKRGRPSLKDSER